MAAPKLAFTLLCTVNKELKWAAAPQTHAGLAAQSIDSGLTSLTTISSFISQSHHSKLHADSAILSVAPAMACILLPESLFISTHMQQEPAWALQSPAVQLRCKGSAKLDGRCQPDCLLGRQVIGLLPNVCHRLGLIYGTITVLHGEAVMIELEHGAHAKCQHCMTGRPWYAPAYQLLLADQQPGVLRLPTRLLLCTHCSDLLAPAWTLAIQKSAEGCRQELLLLGRVLRFETDVSCAQRALTHDGSSACSCVNCDLCEGLS